MIYLALLWLLAWPTAGASDKSPYVGYLFTHMTTSDYGRLYYSLSRDGLHFTRINGGRRIHEEYRGHTSVTRGHDGRYYMAGGGTPITFWVSADLVRWEKLGEYTPPVKDIPLFANGPGNSSAPKIFFDDPSRQYIVTWQTAQAQRTPNFKGVEERYWGSHRAVYSLSSELRSFSIPKLLFPEHDVAAIDIILYRAGKRYYSIFKDERYPTFDYPAGKSIRIAAGQSVTGPFARPGAPASPSFREAPSVVPRLDGKGWYLYFERYPGEGYEVATAATLTDRGSTCTFVKPLSHRTRGMASFCRSRRNSGRPSPTPTERSNASVSADLPAGAAGCFWSVRIGMFA